MPVVRPSGGTGSLGLILPTAPQGEIPAHDRTTSGSTCGGTSGATTGGTTLADLTRTCADAEAAGAGALWAVDHLFWPGPMTECLTALTVAVGATRTAAVGSCVLQLPLRSPAAVAKQVGTLQALSGGRMVLGVGSGSHPGEYAAAGADFAGRGAALDAGIEALRAAWGPPADPRYAQRPAHPPVPVWVGGASAAARRRAARTGDGWIPLFVSPEEYGAGLRALRAETEAAGRPADAVTPAVVVMVAPEGADGGERAGAWLSSLYRIPAHAFARHVVTGPPGACAEAIDRWRRAGAEHVAVMVAGDRPLARFAQLVAAGAGGDRAVPAAVAVPA